MQESIPKKIDINEPIVWFDFIANFRLQLFFYHKLYSLWIFHGIFVTKSRFYYHLLLPQTLQHMDFFYSRFVLSILNLLQDLFEFEAWDK